MRSVLAIWRVGLQRIRTDWPVVVAAWLIMLLAAVVFAAGAIYPSAASEAGLRRALADAPAADVQIELSRYGSATDAGAVDDRVRATMAAAIAPVGGAIVRDWQVTPTFGLADGSGAADRLVLGALDDLPAHATLIAGSWPTGGSYASSELQVAVLAVVAQDLGLAVGDGLHLTSEVAGVPRAVAGRLVGIYVPTEAADGYWAGDPQLLAGFEASGGIRFFGPFMTTPEALLVHVGGAPIHLRWRALPAFERLRVEDVPGVANRVAGLPDQLAALTGEPFQMATGVPAILSDAERSLLVSRTGVLLLMAQLAILAGYAIVLTALLLVDHRRVDTALLRSRGAGAAHVAVLALVEGLVLAVPAVVVAPWLAVGALDVLNTVGPLADIQLRIDPRVSAEAYLVAGIGALACVALLVLPAALAARNFATEQGGLSRQETRTFGQRLGLDVALLAVTGIALWQLRLYGAPLTRTVQGSLGLDPLLVATPAIGLVAGAVVALRVLPLLADLVERVVARGAGLVSSLGWRELARRPLRHTRAALLLMLAMSMGAFATCYAATWAGSQADQAAYQAGAEVRVQPDRSAAELPAWAWSSSLGGLQTIAAASPVERIQAGVSIGSTSSADLLALDAATAGQIVLFRADESATPIDALLGPLREGRPDPDLPTLPAAASLVRIVPRLDITSASRLVTDPATGDETSEAVDPKALGDVQLQASITIRDARGLLYSLTSSQATFAGPSTTLTVPLSPSTLGASGFPAPASAALEGPLQIVGLGLQVWLPAGTTITDGSVGVAGLTTGPDAAGPWTELPVASVGTWSAKVGNGYLVPEDVPPDQVLGTTIRISGLAQGSIFGQGSATPAARLAFAPASLASAAVAVPAIANAAFQAAMGSTVGATMSATIEGRLRNVRIAGVVDSFPTTDPARPLLIVDEPTLGLLRLEATGDTRSPDEWWLAPTTGAGEALATSIRGSPFNVSRVLTADERTRGLSTDPVALAILGTLTLGFVATGLFAAVGLTVSSGVSARQRRTEFALLRALGLSARQLSN
ncbi:MAG TPA: FtsX-like permease family protein, partial [Candidatus Binatus sp.]|nr:FtsX-like permease family protein [Candidatus Binatus sp.]